MSSKQRLVFLREFTKQLVLNSRKTETRIFFSEHPLKPEIPHIPLNFDIKLIQPAPLAQNPQNRIRIMPQMVKPMQMQIQQGIKTNPALDIKPTAESLPSGFSLGKIDVIIQDPKVSTIECPGPGKFVLVKSLGRVSPTRITLSEEEIKKIVEIFSQQAKIPVIEGVFKAAVGNLIITSVISEFVGSRFIINKYSAQPVNPGQKYIIP